MSHRASKYRIFSDSKADFVPTSFPGSLILPPLGASEERPWHTLVACHFDTWKHQGGVLYNQAIGCVELCRISSIALFCDRHYPWCLSVLCLQDEISNIIYSNVYLRVKQASFECVRLNWCKKHNNFSRKTYSFLKVKLRQPLKKSWLKEDNMIFAIKNNKLCLQFRSRHHNIEPK